MSHRVIPLHESLVDLLDPLVVHPVYLEPHGVLALPGPLALGEGDDDGAAVLGVHGVGVAQLDEELGVRGVESCGEIIVECMNIYDICSN